LVYARHRQCDELIDQQGGCPERHCDEAEQRKPAELALDEILRQVSPEAGRRRSPRRCRWFATADETSFFNFNHDVFP
jgi:hypothetical protein